MKTTAVKRICQRNSYRFSCLISCVQVHCMHTSLVRRMSATSVAPHTEKIRLPKKKVALVVAYDGSHFMGSQYSPHVPTVDGALVRALLDAELIEPSHAYDFEKLLWTRASRTDKGVHATCNVVTVKIRAPASAYDNTRHSKLIVDKLNDKLPSFLRVLDAVHVPGSFSPYHDAVSRVYHYFMPLAALMPEPLNGTVIPAEAALQASRRLQQTLSTFVGTHSFHNFTLPGVRAESVLPADPELWKRLGIHPSSSTQSSSSPTNDDSAENTRVYENYFTRLYDAIFKRGDADIREYRHFNMWNVDNKCKRTIYSVSTDILDSRMPDSSKYLLPKCIASPFGFKPKDLLHGSALLDENYDNTAPTPTDSLAQNTPVRITLHGSSFMYHQIRHMLSAAIAVHHGLLPRDYIHAALTLPCLPALPLAPPSGLVQAEVHFSSRTYVSLYHPPGVDDTAQPVVSMPIRESLFNDPKHIQPLAAAALAPDIALLRQTGQQARQSFFHEHLMPRIMASFNSDRTIANTSTATTTPNATAPSFTQWLQSLRASVPPLHVQQAAMDWYAMLSPEKTSHEESRTATSLRKQKAIAAQMWQREGKHAPLLLPRPIHLSASGEQVTPPAVYTDSKDNLRLQKFRLAEVKKMLIPNGTSTSIAIETGIAKHADLNDIIRAVCWRIAQAEWPVAATAQQHGLWVKQSNPAVLLREGKLLYWLERAESRNAAAHDYYVRKAQRNGKDLSQEWGQYMPPLQPLTVLYADSFPKSRGGQSIEAALAQEEMEEQRERRSKSKEGRELR